MRWLIATAAALVLLAGRGAPSPVSAQPAAGPAEAERLVRDPTPAPTPRAGASADAPAAAGATHLANGKGAALLFWFLAFTVVVGGLFIITRRNLVTAVMGMVGTFFAIAGLFVMLYASFLAAIQVLVYAGAIMVLFVFVVMILNKEEEEPWALQGLLGKGLALVALVYLLTRVGQVLWGVQATAAATPAPVGQDYAYGSTKALGHTLFRDYLLPFEAVSLVLLIAVVGALAVARAPAAAAGASEEAARE